jgi:hypothetical protein
MANATWPLPMTRSEPIADAASAEPLAIMRRGSAMPDRIEMIPQTKSRSMIAKPRDERRHLTDVASTRS